MKELLRDSRVRLSATVSGSRNLYSTILSSNNGYAILLLITRMLLYVKEHSWRWNRRDWEWIPNPAPKVQCFRKIASILTWPWTWLDFRIWPTPMPLFLTDLLPCKVGIGRFLMSLKSSMKGLHLNGTDCLCLRASDCLIASQAWVCCVVVITLWITINESATHRLTIYRWHIVSIS